MPPESISVVVPTHNRRDGLPELLDALAGEAANEIVVVVSSSDDGSLELLRERAADDDRLVPISVAEPGAAVARQRGVEQSTSDVVLLLDDDVIPAPGLVAGHLARHREQERLVVLGYMPVATPAERHPGEYPVYLYAKTYENVCALWEREPNSILNAVWGGNISIRRSDCLSVGLTPADMPADYSYHEDLDFGLRCAAAGMRGLFDRRLAASHRYERTRQAYIRSSRSAGRMRASIHVIHREELGPLPPDFYEKGTPVPGKWLIRWARRRVLFGPIVLFLRAIAALSGRLRLFAVESHAGHLLGTVEQQHCAFGAEAETR